jgi:hypothetical protein
VVKTRPIRLHEINLHCYTETWKKERDGHESNGVCDVDDGELSTGGGDVPWA